MSARQFHPIAGFNGIGHGLFELQFTTNGTGAIDQTLVKGRYVTSVTRSGTGQYDIVLDGGFFKTTTLEAFTQEDPAAVAGTVRGIRALAVVADETAVPYTIRVFTVPYNSNTATDYGAGSGGDVTPTRVCIKANFRTSSA